MYAMRRNNITFTF